MDITEKAQEEVLHDNGHMAETARIVVGIDGSHSSLEAMRWAGRQADLTRSTLHVVMTWEWPLTYGWAMPCPSPPAMTLRRRYVRFSTRPWPTCAPHTRQSTSRPKAVHGHPPSLLVEASEGADLLVVGRGSHGEFTGMLIGSVSEFCATNAHCPVLVQRAVS
jgi:nucleotide-binding universal stress UspA family protein